MAGARRVSVVVSGRVQGVFCASAAGEAERRDLRGWVRNLHDGRVEILAEGDDDDVAALIAWARRGPDHARVDDVDVRELPLDGDPLGAFEVR